MKGWPVQRKIIGILVSVAIAVLSVLGFGVPAALAGGTSSVTTNVTGIARGNVLPAFEVTVGYTNPPNTISGATFQVFDTWSMNPAPQTPSGGRTLTASGQCGIESMTDGVGVSVPFDGSFSCKYKANGSSSFSNYISVYPTVTSVPLTVTQPLTVRFADGIFTAPKSTTATTPWRVLARNDDPTEGGATIVQLNFNLIDAVTTPAQQSISCEQGQPMESKPLSTTGMNGTVTYGLSVDPPTGVTINPVTGVIAGTPATEVDPTEWLVSVTSSTGQIGSACIYVNKPVPMPMPAPLPDTGIDSRSLIGGATMLLALGVVLVAARRRFNF